MLIKDVYEKIKDLEKDRENFIKIQNFCLGHDGYDEETYKGKHTEVYGALEDGAHLTIDLRSLASKTIGNIDSEIARLKRIIENTQVKID